MRRLKKRRLLLRDLIEQVARVSEPRTCVMAKPRCAARTLWGAT